MIHRPHVDWFALSPSLAMICASGLLLLVAVLVPRRVRKQVAAVGAAGGFLTAFVFAIVLADRSPHAETAVADAIFRDRWAAVAQLIVAGCGFVTVLISYGEHW